MQKKEGTLRPVVGLLKVLECATQPRAGHVVRLHS